MDGQDHTSKTLLALSCVEELSLKKKTVLLDTIDVDEIGTEDAKDIVFKILGDDHATDFYKKLQSVDDIVEDLKRGTYTISLATTTSIPSNLSKSTTDRYCCL